MKQFFSVALVFLALAGTGCGSSHLNRDHKGGPGYRVMPSEFWENGEATVIVREVDSASGTGAVIRRDGYVLTNWHVVEPKVLKRKAPDGTITVGKSSGKFEVCQVKGNDESCAEAKLIRGDAERDLAVLKVERRYEHAISFVDDSGLMPFDFVYSWANVSFFLPPSPFRGRYVNRIVPPKGGVKIAYLVIDLSLNPGGSGSPVFDRTGRCIGIAMGTTAIGGAPLEIVIPSSEVVAFLKETGFTHVLAPAETSVGPKRGK